MKKILVLNPYIPTLGGGEKHMGYLCQFMEEYFDEGVKIDILVFNYNDIDVTSPDYVTIDMLNRQYDLHLAKTTIRKVTKEELRDGEDMEKHVSKLTREYDYFINFMIFSRLLPKAKKNIYFCMFPPKTRVQESAGKNIWNRFHDTWADRKFISSYDCFVMNSQYSNHWFHEFWKGSRRTTVIYPPVFSEKDLSDRYEEGKKKNIIISVGRFFVDAHSKKQLEMVSFFVNHIEEFADYEYHLVGAVSNYAKDLEYLQRVKDVANQTDRVFIHENCSFSVLMDLYKAAKIFWHATGYGIDGNLEPEKMEHFGITTVEAMSFGAVPVVINKGGQTETVGEGENGFRWDTEQECVDKTKRLIADDALREKMAAESAKRARNYSIEEFYRRNREVFDEL